MSIKSNLPTEEMRLLVDKTYCVHDDEEEISKLKISLLMFLNDLTSSATLSLCILERLANRITGDPLEDTKAHEAAAQGAGVLAYKLRYLSRKVEEIACHSQLEIDDKLRKDIKTLIESGSMGMTEVDFKSFFGEDFLRTPDGNNG